MSTGVYRIVALYSVCLLVITTVVVSEDSFQLSVLHFNDFHARFEEQSLQSGSCKPTDDVCIGGFSRLFTAITNLMAERTNPILLNAGDNFQGTLWYNMFKWNVTQYFMNMLPFSAYVLGNHEFDDNIDGLVPFMKGIKAPMVVSNINDSLVPEMQGLYKKSVVIDVDGKKIGIVGVILSTTDQIAKTGDLIFLDEVESVNKEANRLVSEEGVFTVIVLSHCGYDVEKRIAKKAVKHISLIVGGHSHTLLYNGTPPAMETSEVLGPYPTVVERDVDGKICLVVQAAAYTKYLGDVTINYDSNGEVSSWEGQPVHLGPEVPQNETINGLLEPYRELVEAKGKQVLGNTKVVLQQSTCRIDECNLGNFITDAMVYAYVDKAERGSWTYASLAVMNAGGIRTSIEIGNITYNDMVLSQPFENTFDVGELQGKYIKEFLEQTATDFKYNEKTSAPVNLLQLSGFQVVYDLSKPKGSRIKSCKLRCRKCDVPVYEDLNLDLFYRIAVPSFLVTGGDGYTAISDNLKNHQRGERDMVIYERYIPKESPIIIGKEGRIVFEGPVAHTKIKYPIK